MGTRFYSFDRDTPTIEPSAVDQNEYSQRQYTPEGRPIEPTFGQKVKKFMAPLGVLGVVILKYLKFFLPVM